MASDEELQDVAYNPINRKIYYCNYTRVFWANLDGSANEALESNVDCEFKLRSSMIIQHSQLISKLFITVPFFAVDSCALEGNRFGRTYGQLVCSNAELRQQHFHMQHKLQPFDLCSDLDNRTIF